MGWCDVPCAWYDAPACLSPSLCPLGECVVAPDWSRAGDLLDDSNCCCQCVQYLLIDALEKVIFNCLDRNDCYFKLLEKCLQKVLTDHATWHRIAQSFDGLIQEENGVSLKLVVNTLVKTNAYIQNQGIVSSFKQWCVDNGHSNLAFCLAVVTEDWRLVEILVNTHTTSLNPYCTLLLGAAQMAAEKGQFSTGATMLKICPLNDDTHLWSLPSHRHERKQLGRACHDAGLLDWALVLYDKDWTYIREHHRQCHNHVVLNYLLRESCRHWQWELTQEFMARCSDPETLSFVLRETVEEHQVNIAEVLMSRVDSSTCVPYNLLSGRETLLHVAVKNVRNFDQTRSAVDRLCMVSMCIAYGLSTFQRLIGLSHVGPSFTKNNNCPLVFALEIGDSQLIKLLLESGAYSFKRLCEILNDQNTQRKLKGADKKWKECYQCIVKAAATPCRLEHLARLVVSHSVGCGPGRSDRIQALPLPQRIKALLWFEDVLSIQTEDNTDSVIVAGSERSTWVDMAMPEP